MKNSVQARVFRAPRGTVRTRPRSDHRTIGASARSRRCSLSRHGGVPLTVLLLLTLLAGLATPAGAALWRRAQSGTDLWYSGFLHAEASYTDLTGSVYDFEEGYFHGEKDGSMDLKGSFHANGPLNSNLNLNTSILFDTRFCRYPQRYWDRRFWDTFRMRIALDTPRPINNRWDFHARAKYDRDATWRNEYPDARLLMEPIDDAYLEVFAHLESRNWIFEGGDMRPDYGARGFVLYERSVRALRANGHNENIEADLIGGLTRGVTYLQTPDDSLGIPADGTAGPYRLGHAPIVRGSEIVSIEVRDRFDHTILIRRTQQRRNVDYTVDYLRGIITFMAPVESETFERNPVFISVQYSYDQRATGYRRYIAATRANFQLGQSAKAGVLYSGLYDDAGSWRGEETYRTPAQRLAAYGGTLEADPWDRTHMNFAIAWSDSSRLGGENNNTAIGFDIDFRTLQPLVLKLDYQRLEYGFEPLDNHSFVGQRNRQIIRLDGAYRASQAIELEGGGRHVSSANPEFDDQAYTDQLTFVGLRYRPAERTELFGRQEWRSAVDEKVIHLKDEQRYTTLLEGQQKIGARSIARLAAEYEQFENQVLEGNEGWRTATWRIRARGEAVPKEWIKSPLVWLSDLVKDRGTNTSRDRLDRFEWGLELTPQKGYGLRGLYTWQGDYALDASGWNFTGGTRTRHIYSFSAGTDIRPWNPLQLLVSYDREKLHDDVNAVDERESELIRAEGYWFVTRDLELHSAGTREDLRDVRKIGVGYGLLRRYERRFEIDLTYNWNTRLSLFAGYLYKKRRIYQPDWSDTDVNRLLLGGNLHVTRRLEIIARLRYTDLDGQPVAYSGSESILINDALENRRWIVTGEVAWDIGNLFRLSGGYETLEYEVTSVESSPDDYAADRFFLKLMNKF